MAVRRDIRYVEEEGSIEEYLIFRSLRCPGIPSKLLVSGQRFRKGLRDTLDLKWLFPPVLQVRLNSFPAYDKPGRSSRKTQILAGI